MQMDTVVMRIPRVDVNPYWIHLQAIKRADGMQVPQHVSTGPADTCHQDSHPSFGSAPQHAISTGLSA
jgi:hypothetical protein